MSPLAGSVRRSERSIGRGGKGRARISALSHPYAKKSEVSRASSTLNGDFEAKVGRTASVRAVRVPA